MRSWSTPSNARSLTPSELELSYRHSSLAPGQVVAQVRFRLEPRPVVAIRAHVAELLAQRKATQPTTKRTFGSVFKNPSAEQGAGRLIEECGLKGHRIGGAVISSRHANFIENAGGATSADAIALMAEARRRVHERFGLELEHEVRFLGPLELPAAVGKRACHRRTPTVAQRTRVPARARPVTAGVRRFLPSGRMLAIGFGGVALIGGAYAAALETSVFSVRKIAIVGGTPRVQDELRQALAPELGRSLLRIDSSQIDRSVAAIPDLVGVTYDRQFPHTLRVRVNAERPVLLVRRGADTWLVSARARVMQQLRTPRLSSLPRVWVPKGTAITVGSTLRPADGGLAAAALAPIARHTFPTGVRFVRSSGLRVDARSRLRARGAPRRSRRPAAQARDRASGSFRPSAPAPSTSGYLDVSVPERPVVKATNSQLSSGA